MNNKNKQSLKEQIIYLETILNQLNQVKTPLEKIQVLNESSGIKSFLDASLEDFFDELPLEKNMLFKILIVIGQAPIFLALYSKTRGFSDKFIHVLKETNEFYETSKGTFDGLIVYQLNLLRLILEHEKENSETESFHDSSTTYLKPIGMDFASDSTKVREMVRMGIENLEHLAEIYPVGGAGERLKLNSLTDHKLLPVATLRFCGRSLLEGLIRDLEGREFLYHKLTGKQLIVPVAMMTSNENENHELIHNLCEQNDWFKRSKENFFLFSQPMVPVSTINGSWLLSTDDNLLLKPGGHGVIWKLGLAKGVFDWLKKQHKTKLLSRQINNPIAGVDSGLLGFTGVGFKGNYLFGFSSCDRLLHTSEGMDILVEKKTKTGFEYKITNIEYTEFVKNGIEDCPETKGGHISKFPANTNILFLDIENIEKMAKLCKVPGMLINMKSTVPYVDSSGLLTKIKAGRLESTMQNAADVIIDTFPNKLTIKELKQKELNEEPYLHLSSFLTYNKRNKTISVTKKSFTGIESFIETPESCFYDVYKNNHELFSNDCRMQLPEISSIEEYLESGPSFMMTHHPALGPLYSVIAQKIRGGKCFKNAELQLEIAEVDLEGLELDGSLLIYADHVVGAVDGTGVLQYGRNLGKCTLKNVKIKNLGIDRKAKNIYWKNEIKRLESLKITIHGNGELVAENVTVLGHLELEVMDGERLIISSKEGKLIFDRQKVEKEKYWDYAFDREDRVVLNRI